MTASQPFLATSRELLDLYYAQYDADIASGKYEPIVLPWCLAPSILVFAYLLIPHQKSFLLRQAHFLILAFIVGFTTYQIMYCRTRNMAPCYGNGVIAAWLVITYAATNIFNDAQSDFKRIVHTDRITKEDRVSFQKDVVQNDHTNESRHRSKELQHGETRPVKSHDSSDQPHRGFAWQSYPMASFKDRLQWVLDFSGSPRGVNWNWRTRTIRRPPKRVLEHLREKSGIHHATERESHPTRSDVLREALKNLAISYLFLDLAKGIMARDPYFWGIFDRPPPEYLPAFISSSEVLLRVYRLYVTLFGVRYALEAVYSLGPLFFAGIASPFVGVWAEPWMFPSTFGSPMSILERGLAGAWADWWHQTFRFGLESPSKWFISATGMNPRSISGKLVQALIAFTLSGAIHACGSVTQAGPTEPLRPFLFFVTQAFGCVVEDVLTGVARRAGLYKAVPKPVRWTFTVAYLHIWWYYTGPLMADDMARGGIWLTDPVPFSPLRALGLGPPGDERWLPWGLWPWEGQWAYFHRGSTWWKSGLAI